MAHETISADQTALFTDEWLETDGRGGWSSSTVVGAHSRRYHGLFVTPGTTSGRERFVMLSRLDESFLISDKATSIATRQFPDCYHPRGFEYLKQFDINPCPHFTYQLGHLRLTKRVIMPRGGPGLIITYCLEEATEPVTLQLEPFIAARSSHHFLHETPDLSTEFEFDAGLLTLQPRPELPTLYLWIPGAAFDFHPHWHYHFYHGREAERGFEPLEDLLCMGAFQVTLCPGKEFSLLVSCEEPGASIRNNPQQLSTLVATELARRGALEEGLSVRDSVTKRLSRAADQFIVRWPGGETSIIAGYHWFTDWGRDSMIALPGLCLVTGRVNEATDILKTFAANISEGMVPNRFAEGDVPPEYNAVDASLWFVIAVYHYLLHGGDRASVETIFLPAVFEILEHYQAGTRFNIHADSDGLLIAGDEHTQLTWMDACLNGHPVTPRHGKAVEVNALWYNALSCGTVLCEKLGVQLPPVLHQFSRDMFRDSFRRQFWNEARSCLFDCLHDGQKDGSIRPNQLFAIGLPFPLLAESDALTVLAVVEEKLFTPYGLRTLAPEEDGYQAHYRGDVVSRDHAYHQGTVWPWLFGAYGTALIRYRGAAGRTQAKRLITTLCSELNHNGRGTISEIFDAEAPHTPRGCIAQAWSVAEALRVYAETL